MLSSSLMLTCGHAPLPPFRKPRRLTLDRTAAVTQTSASLSTFLPGRGGGAAAPRRGWAQICRDSSRPGADAAEQDRESKNDLATATVPKIGGGGGGGGGGGQLSDWITSVLLFGIWAGLMYYVLQLAPNQTPYRDTYFLQKLLNLKVDDGFRMNNVLVSLWYIMGIWPLVYSMLLLPTGRRLSPREPVGGGCRAPCNPELMLEVFVPKGFTVLQACMQAPEAYDDVESASGFFSSGVGGLGALSRQDLASKMSSAGRADDGSDGFGARIRVLQVKTLSLPFSARSCNVELSHCIYVTAICYCSSKSKIPVWPFLVLSCIGGAYALIPYFVLWKPPPPAIDEDEIGQWPLKFLESKLTAGVIFAVGLGLIIFAGKAGGDDWREFFQYFRESKFEKRLGSATGSCAFAWTLLVSFAASISVVSARGNLFII
uniref:Uncharacterized protein n=1 Tax=Aegilops tauschii TaxID=37682 RepID=N1R187_AEGTA